MFRIYLDLFSFKEKGWRETFQVLAMETEYIDQEERLPIRSVLWEQVLLSSSFLWCYLGFEK